MTVVSGENRRILACVNARLRRHGLRRQIEPHKLYPTMDVFVVVLDREQAVWVFPVSRVVRLFSRGHFVDTSGPFVGRGWLDSMTAKIVELVEKYGGEDAKA